MYPINRTRDFARLQNGVKSRGQSYGYFDVFRHCGYSAGSNVSYCGRYLRGARHDRRYRRSRQSGVSVVALCVFYFVRCYIAGTCVHCPAETNASVASWRLVSIGGRTAVYYCGWRRSGADCDDRSARQKGACISRDACTYCHCVHSNWWYNSILRSSDAVCHAAQLFCDAWHA